MPLHSQIDSHKIHEGYLYKKGIYNKSWKRRYFVLYDDRTIDYFQDQSSSTQRNKAKGTIYLTQIKKVELVPYNTNTNKQSIANYCNSYSAISSVTDASLLLSKTTFSSDISVSCHCDELINSTNTHSTLKSDKIYSFALISDSRTWILSAENNTKPKQWISKCNYLCQGAQIYDGYLNSKYFILYQNKVLNCYKNNLQQNIEFDIDLRHILYIKYNCKKQIEIATTNNDKPIILKAANAFIAGLWYHKFMSLFTDAMETKKYADSLMDVHINIIHNGQQLKNRCIVMYYDYIVIFQNKKLFNSIQNMVFFNKTLFRNYMKKKQCILIPLNRNIRVNKCKNNPKHIFIISNANGDRQWHFKIKSVKQMQHWMDLLGSKCHAKRRTFLSTLRCDIEKESTFSFNKTKLNSKQ